MPSKQLTQKAAVAKPVENKLAERVWVTIWYVDGILLVPHYTKQHVFVWPGGKFFTPDETNELLSILKNKDLLKTLNK